MSFAFVTRVLSGVRASIMTRLEVIVGCFSDGVFAKLRGCLLGAQLSSTSGTKQLSGRDACLVREVPSFCESRVRPLMFYLDVPLSGSRMAGLADHSLSSRIGVQLTSLLSEPRGEPDRYFGLGKKEKKETMGRVLNPLFTRSLRYLRY